MAVIPLFKTPKGLTKPQELLYIRMVYQGYSFYCDNNLKTYKCWLAKNGRDNIVVDRRVALSLSKKKILIPDVSHDVKKYNTCLFVININNQYLKY